MLNKVYYRKYLSPKKYKTRNVIPKQAMLNQLKCVRLNRKTFPSISLSPDNEWHGMAYRLREDGKKLCVSHASHMQ